ncbi:MAG: hypothetical protein IKW68_01025, partial [Clostridia bacterium]|nr:hypothetical protein [Clostridia bacterium]
MSIIINRIMKATLSDQDGVEYKVMFPENDNYFRFLPMLSRLAGNTTQKIEKLTVDNIVIPCELFNKDILGKHFNLKADVVV